MDEAAGDVIDSPRLRRQRTEAKRRRDTAARRVAELETQFEEAATFLAGLPAHERGFSRWTAVVIASLAVLLEAYPAEATADALGVHDLAGLLAAAGAICVASTLVGWTLGKLFRRMREPEPVERTLRVYTAIWILAAIAYCGMLFETRYTYANLTFSLGSPLAPAALLTLLAVFGILLGFIAAYGVESNEYAHARRDLRRLRRQLSAARHVLSKYDEWFERTGGVVSVTAIGEPMRLPSVAAGEPTPPRSAEVGEPARASDAIESPAPLALVERRDMPAEWMEPPRLEETKSAVEPAIDAESTRS